MGHLLKLWTARLCGFAPLPAVCLAISSALAEQPRIQDTNSPDLLVFLRFATNCPPIEDLLLRVEWTGSTTNFYQFRYQNRAFFGRQVTDYESALREIEADDEGCGYWEDEYWASERNAGGQPILHLYSYKASDTNSTAYQRCQLLKKILGWYTTFGLSDQGIDNVKSERGKLVLAHAEKGTSISAEVVAVGGTPSHADVEKTWRQDMVSIQQLSYVYDISVTSLPIPVAVRIAQRTPDGFVTYATLSVIRMRVGDPGRPQPENAFRPVSIFGNRSLRRVIYTNGVNYLQVNDSLVPMDVQSAQKLYNPYRGHAARKYTLATILGLGLLLILCLAVSRRGKKNSQAKH